MLGSNSGWPEGVQYVLRTLAAADFEAFLVGGCVRDYILGRPIHDYDIATNATPAEVTKLFQKVKPTGLQHGTVTVLTTGPAVEVTTYRVDGKYSDGRHPDKVSFTRNIHEDLARRDFTINAMAISSDGQLRDPFHGRQDLDQGILRTVGNPQQRFFEDGLRILRGLRFAAELNLELHAETKQAMFQCSSRLCGISAERVGKELMRIAASNWWPLRRLLADGPWLKETSPSLQLLCQALTGLQNFEEKAEDWNRTIEEYAGRNIHLKLIGFAATMMQQTASTSSLNELAIAFRRLAWPKEIGLQATVAAKLSLSEPQRWTVRKWRQNLFDNGQSSVELACRLADWFSELSPLTAGWALEDFYQYIASQPLYSIHDLNIDGHRLRSLGAQGTVIGALKRRLASEVLHSDLPNDTSTLSTRSQELLKEFYNNVDNP